jgi:hypothetical protein
MMTLSLMGVCLAFGTYGAIADATEGNHFTFLVDQSWSAPERTQLQNWLSATGPVMQTVVQVAGPPSESMTLTVTKESTGYAGEYDRFNHRVVMSSLQLSVLVHELIHAIRNRWIMANSVEEEGLARAGEKEVMRLLALKG